MITRLDDVPAQVASVASRWKAQYGRGGAWGGCRGDSQAIYEGLLALPKTATAADVAAIIGNDSWVGYRCNECRDNHPCGFQLGDEPDYESATVVLCDACAAKYAKFISKALRASPPAGEPK